MNREQIIALFRAGKITGAECGARLKRLPGVRVGMTEMAVEIFATDAEIDTTARTITGTITVFGVESSDGRIIEPGAFVDVREPLDRVKLLVDHDHSDVRGYMTELDIDTERARATFHVPADSAGLGDAALESARLKLKNGLSIGAAAKAGGYFWDENDVLHFTALELFETSMCSIPAFQDAQVEEVAAHLAHNRKEYRMDREQILAAFAAGSITAEQRDAALAIFSAMTPAAPAAPAAPPAPVSAFGPAATVAPIPGAPAPAEYSAGPTGGNAGGTDHGHTQDRPTSFSEIKRTVADFAKAGDRNGLVNYVNAELGKVGVEQVDDDGAGYLRPDFQGELWTAGPEGRPWIDSFGGAAPLTSDKVEGFRWAYPSEYTETGADVEARAKIYAGNFAEVPTGTRKLVKVSMDPDQWGVAVKVDNITIDLGSPDLVDSLFRLFARDYDQDSDKRVRDLIVAAATEPVGPDGGDPDTDPDPIVDTSVIGALTGTALALKRIGANLDRIWLAEDVFTDFSELTIADLPAWLANQLGFVDLSDGSAQVSSKLRMDVDFGLPSGSMLGYDRRAATPKEKKGIRLQAIDVAHRATDIGFFSYGGVLINDARAIHLRTIA